MPTKLLFAFALLLIEITLAFVRISYHGLRSQLKCSTNILVDIPSNDLKHPFETLSDHAKN